MIGDELSFLEGISKKKKKRNVWIVAKMSEEDKEHRAETYLTVNVRETGNRISV